ncbi:MAG: hypothetical protein ACYCQJ_01755 [Nitrososphaerales archaeon]
MSQHDQMEELEASQSTHHHDFTDESGRCKYCGISIVEVEK